jgi:hypothetical protein
VRNVERKKSIRGKEKRKRKERRRSPRAIHMMLNIAKSLVK